MNGHTCRPESIERDPFIAASVAAWHTRSPQRRDRRASVRWTIVRLGIAIFFSMNLMAFTMTMWSLDVYDVQRDPFQTQLFEVFRWLSMLFSLPVLLLLGVPLLQNAIHQLASADFFHRPADRDRRGRRIRDFCSQCAAGSGNGLL